MYIHEINTILGEFKNLLGSHTLEDNAKTLNTQISINDDMYQGNISHYLRCGAEAAFLIRNYSKYSGKKENLRILDFPCGYGRVTRWLRFLFPDCRLVGSDTTLDAIEFSKLNFAMEAFEAKANFQDNKIEEKFDLIWVGSLITHISQERGVELLDFLISLLDHDSKLFVSFLGEEMQYRFDAEDAPYGLTKESAENILVTFREKGYGFSDYPNQQGYGISLISSKWWIDYFDKHQDYDLKIISLGWDKHHNIAVISRR